MQRFTHRSESSESLLRLSRLGVLHWGVEFPRYLALSAGGLNLGSPEVLWEKDLLLVSHKSYLTLCGPVSCSSPGSSVHGSLQARMLGGSGLPFLPPLELLDSRIKPVSLASPALAGGFFTS